MEPYRPKYCIKEVVEKMAAKRGLILDDEFYERLDKEIEEVLASACERAKKAGRKTLKAYDFQ